MPQLLNVTNYLDKVIEMNKAEDIDISDYSISPIVSWAEDSNAEIYYLRVYDSSNNEIHRSPRLESPSYQIPENVMDYGNIYYFRLLNQNYDDCDIYDWGQCIENRSSTWVKFIPMNALKLSGIEIVKGIDICDIRWGTTFIGKVYEGSLEVGNWWTVIRHTNTENIEVCGGTNNLLKVKLVVNLYDGNRLVLGLSDHDNEEEVVWDAIAPLCGPSCNDESCACPNNPDLIRSWICEEGKPEGYGPVATIENLELREKFGTTMDIESASLTGFLCHNWAFIPRVAATLNIVWSE